MFSTFNKLKQSLDSSADENKASIEAKPEKTEQEIKKEKIAKFLTALDDVAWDLHDDSSFYRDSWSEKREKKRQAACAAYGKRRDFDPILQVDTTTFGSGKCGMMFARDGIYIGEFDDSTKFIAYEDLFGRKFKTRDGKFCIGSREYEFHASSAMRKLSPVISLLNNYFS